MAYDLQQTLIVFKQCVRVLGLMIQWFSDYAMFKLHSSL